VKLPDVNVLVAAHREDAPEHASVKAWLEERLIGDESFGVSDLVLSGFVRVVTHPRVFAEPSPLEDALEFAAQVRGAPAAVPVEPGPRHWEIFARLCTTAAARGNLVPDAYLAALAIESGSEWVTFDRDFSRFEGLRWSLPGA
jgi:toxin-antitoxin system PIN domain toxin